MRGTAGRQRGTSAGRVRACGGAATSPGPGRTCSATRSAWSAPSAGLPCARCSGRRTGPGSPGPSRTHAAGARSA